METAASFCTDCIALCSRPTHVPHRFLVRMAVPSTANWNLFSCSRCPGVFTQPFVQGTPRGLMWVERGFES